MIRSPFLRTAFLTLSIGAPVVACGGQVISIGSNQDKLSSVDPSAVSGTIGACQDGYAHPNVCCTGGPHQASACGAYEAKPFRPCDPGAITYPNPLTCCPLDGNGSCIDAPSGGASTPSHPPSTSCTYACPPGWWEDPETPVSQGNGGNGSSQDGQGQAPPSSGTSCCHVDATGASLCVGYGGASTGPSTGTVCVPVPTDASVGDDPTQGDGGAPTPLDASSGDPFDAGPGTPADANDVPDADDASTNPSGDGGCVGTDAGAPITNPPVPGVCNVPCPSGWTSQVGAPDVCCRDVDQDTRECFSQAVGGGGTPGAPIGDDPGPTSCYGSSPSSQSDGGASCGCRSIRNGHSYDLECTSGAQCTCRVDGVEGDSVASASADLCSSPSKIEQIFASCLPR